MKVRLRVKEVAKAKGFSMTRLHIKSEVAYNTIRRIFHDPYVEVTTTTLVKLAEALNVRVEDLIETVDEDESVQQQESRTYVKPQRKRQRDHRSSHSVTKQSEQTEGGCVVP
ncbi:MAG: helix-turn-helix transcriptional regulator [Thermogemmatispora sp.]|uniref:helix-turn-helix domain-containing protein n=1 Tax=Thermogemmatispora sp. TaxID=1968838 RepID=UPI0019DFA6AF|nr:helix-turn-helix transcriptional regulator [Thermogemmatispora sp.]